MRDAAGQRNCSQVGLNAWDDQPDGLQKAHLHAVLQLLRRPAGGDCNAVDRQHRVVFTGDAPGWTPRPPDGLSALSGILG